MSIRDDLARQKKALRRGVSPIVSGRALFLNSGASFAARFMAELN